LNSCSGLLASSNNALLYFIACLLATTQKRLISLIGVNQLQNITSPYSAKQLPCNLAISVLRKIDQVLKLAALAKNRLELICSLLKFLACTFE
jgi:hypothetical protein